MSELAIASVRVQEWEQPYEAEKALKMGSIFPKLHKPFFVEEEMKGGSSAPLSAKEAMLRELDEVSFSITDLTLFLDTHPGHPEAQTLRSELQQRKKELQERFAAEYYPLTMDCRGKQAETVVPWER